MQPAAGASKEAVETKRLGWETEKERVMDVVENGCAVGSSRDRRKKLGGQWLRR